MRGGEAGEEVCAEGVGEEGRVLGDEGEGAAVGVQGERGYRGVVVGYGAGVWGVESGLSAGSTSMRRGGARYLSRREMMLVLPAPGDVGC